MGISDAAGINAEREIEPLPGVGNHCDDAIRTRTRGIRRSKEETTDGRKLSRSSSRRPEGSLIKNTEKPVAKTSALVGTRERLMKKIPGIGWLKKLEYGSVSPRLNF